MGGGPDALAARPRGRATALVRGARAKVLASRGENPGLVPLQRRRARDSRHRQRTMAENWQRQQVVDGRAFYRPRDPFGRQHGKHKDDRISLELPPEATLAGHVLCAPHQQAWFETIYSRLQLEQVGTASGQVHLAELGRDNIPAHTERRHTTSISSTAFRATSRIYLRCPFAEKNEAKSKGARYDGQEKKWYIDAGTPLSPFEAWLPDKAKPNGDGRDAERCVARAPKVRVEVGETGMTVEDLQDSVKRSLAMGIRVCDAESVIMTRATSVARQFMPGCSAKLRRR
jgi:hypothetical protein